MGEEEEGRYPKKEFLKPYLRGRGDSKQQAKGRVMLCPLLGFIGKVQFHGFLLEVSGYR